MNVTSQFSIENAVLVHFEKDARLIKLRLLDLMLVPALLNEDDIFSQGVGFSGRKKSSVS